MTAFPTQAFNEEGTFGAAEQAAWMRRNQPGYDPSKETPHITTFTPNSNQYAPHPSISQSSPFAAVVPSQPNPNSPEFEAALRAAGYSKDSSSGQYFRYPSSQGASAGGPAYISPQQAAQIAGQNGPKDFLEQMLIAAGMDINSIRQIMGKRVGEFTGDLANAETALRGLGGEVRGGTEAAASGIEKQAKDNTALGERQLMEFDKRAAEIEQNLRTAEEQTKTFMSAAKTGGIGMAVRDQVEEINADPNMTASEKAAARQTLQTQSLAAVSNVQAENMANWASLRRDTSVALSNQRLSVQAGQRDLASLVSGMIERAGVIRSEGRAQASALELNGWFNLAQMRLQNPESAVSILGPLMQFAQVATAPGGSSLRAIGAA